MPTYDQDIVAWSQEQAHWLRIGQFSALDLEHLAEEIEDVGRSEQRELANRMAVLLAHLLKWRYQPERRGASWEITISGQRQRIARRLQKMPSLKAALHDPEWWADAWFDARIEAAKETDMEIQHFPPECPWTADEILDPTWKPAG
jgi:hypothetical protein